MTIDPGLFLNAIVSGLLLGGFYAAVALGLSIAFGQLDIVNIAHPAFVIVGSYVAYIVNARFGFDPGLIGPALDAGVLRCRALVVYHVYYVSFERTGQESLSGLAFFFGLMFIIEVTLIMIYGVDYRLVPAPYIGTNWQLGLVDFPLRMARALRRLDGHDDRRAAVSCPRPSSAARCSRSPRTGWRCA